MRFKSLEVNGFKSFAEKTRVLFQPGMTAIVGPNGCGKSNISDAIRWVLGEQSAKQIRGEKMEDVIFNGTRSRAPMGMAEVTLIVTDLDAGVSSEFAAFDEIQITRRYYRSGESEYLINRIPCRLMDIRELFMDTGMGSKAYSLIGQGNISSLLNAKPKERRFLFEEAAGISKYKARKDEALRKLERTRENLSRVRDIIAEVTRQRNSLNRQAKKAERYKGYKEEIERIDLHLSSLDYASLQTKWEEIEKEYNHCKNRETEGASLSSSKETRIEELELEVLDIEKSLNELIDKIHRIESDISKGENRVEVLTAEISHLNQTTEVADKEISRLEEEIIHSQTSTEHIEDELRNTAEKIEEREESLSVKQEALSTLITTQQEEERAVEEEKEKISELMRQIGIQKNRVENMVNEKENLQEHHQNFDSSHTTLLNERTQSQREFSEKNESLSHFKTSLDEDRSNQASVLLSLEAKEGEIQFVQKEISHLREQISQEDSRLSTLLELQESLEGYDEGIRSLVRQSKDPSRSSHVPEFHSLVSDIIETEPKYEVAIETALSDLYQSMIVNHTEDSIHAVNYLCQNKIGRGSFIPLQPKNHQNTPFTSSDGAGVVGEALSLVRFDPRFRGVAEYLLGNVVVMESLEQAISLYRSNGFQRTLVTLNGEIVDPSGIVEGGSRKKNTSGFIRRKREIRELKISLDVLKERLSQAEGRRDQRIQELNRIKIEQNEINTRIGSLDTERVELEKEVASLEHHLEHLLKEIKSLFEENEQRSTEILSIEESLAGCRYELEQVTSQHEEKQGRIPMLVQRIHSLRDQIDQERKTITSESIEMASYKEKSSSLLSHIENNRKNIENLNALIQARMREIESAKSRIQEAEAGKKEVEATIHSLIEAKNDHYRKEVLEQEIFDAKRGELQEEQKAFKVLRQEIDLINRKINELDVHRTELSIKKEHLLTKIQEKYHVALQEILVQYQDQEIDRSEAKERLAELNGKIDKMGPVNIMAIEEYNALQERFEFLTTQEADLQESVDSLMAAIRKINRTSRQRFQEAFGAINEKFKLVFNQLFKGGNAELKLEEGEDILDAGIEIIAQPPGKKLQNLSLLSGGESALTAVALIFAGFLVKPSPFCLLDEVDAPLDDNNVERYNLMLKTMADKTQFIVITHNKQTMEHTDALYGITMQEAGISRMVSVKFNDGHEKKLTA